MKPSVATWIQPLQSGMPNSNAGTSRGPATSANQSEVKPPEVKTDEFHNDFKIIPSVGTWFHQSQQLLAARKKAGGRSGTVMT